MVGPTDKSNTNRLGTVTDTEPLNTLGTANTNMNLHPGFLDLINGNVNQNISPKDIIPTIPPADSNLDPDSIDDSTTDLSKATQNLQDMVATFQATYEGAQNRNRVAVLLLKLGNQMIRLINNWMTMSFDQMLAQLNLILSLAQEIAKQQIKQAEETKKSSQYAAIGKIVSGAAGLAVSVGTLAAQTYKEASAASAEKGLTEAETEAGAKVGLPALEKEQSSIAENIVSNKETQTTLKETLDSAEESAGNLTTQRDQAKEQLENDQDNFSKSVKGTDLYKNAEESLQQKYNQQTNLEETVQSFENPDRTVAQTTALKDMLVKSGITPENADEMLSNPNGSLAQTTESERNLAFDNARSEMDQSIETGEAGLLAIRTAMSKPEDILSARQLDDTLEGQYVERENLNKTILSFKDPNRTDAQTTQLKTMLFEGGMDPDTINSVLEDPTGVEAGFYKDKTDDIFLTARENINKPITENEEAFAKMDPEVVRLALNPALTNEQLQQTGTLKTAAQSSKTTLDGLESKLQTQQQNVQTAKANYNQSVKAGEDLAANQKANDEAIEKTKAAISTDTKDQATKAQAARKSADRFTGQGGPAQVLMAANQNITTLIGAAFDLMSADKKYNADMINATITKLQAQSSAASQYMSTDKSQYDNFLQTLLTILGKFADALSSNTRAGG